MRPRSLNPFIPAGVLLILLVAGCTSTSNSQRADTRVLFDDPRRHEMGDDEPHRAPEREETFEAPGRAISATIELNVYRVDHLGAEILLNGYLVKEIDPSVGSGHIKFDVPEDLLPLRGHNRIMIRAKSLGQDMEDFEYDRLKVVATIEAPLKCVRVLAQRLAWGVVTVLAIVWGLSLWIAISASWGLMAPAKILAWFTAAIRRLWMAFGGFLRYRIKVVSWVVWLILSAVIALLVYNEMTGTSPVNFIRTLQAHLSRLIEKGIYFLVQC